MVDSILLKADDQETAVQIGDHIYLPSFLHRVIIDYLLSDIGRANGYLHSKKLHVEIRTLVEGVKSRVLQPRKSWTEGKVLLKVCLEFIPDKPSRDSDLDDFRNTDE